MVVMAAVPNRAAFILRNPHERHKRRCDNDKKYIMSNPTIIMHRMALTDEFLQIKEQHGGNTNPNNNNNVNPAITNNNDITTATENNNTNKCDWVFRLGSCHSWQSFFAWLPLFLSLLHSFLICNTVGGVRINSTAGTIVIQIFCNRRRSAASASARADWIFTIQNFLANVVLLLRSAVVSSFANKS